MRNWLSLGRLLRVVVPGAAVLQLGGCLSDQQITSILTSVITTGLSTLLTGFIGGLFTGLAGGAA